MACLDRGIIISRSHGVGELFAGNTAREKATTYEPYHDRARLQKRHFARHGEIDGVTKGTLSGSVSHVIYCLREFWRIPTGTQVRVLPGFCSWVWFFGDPMFLGISCMVWRWRFILIFSNTRRWTGFYKLKGCSSKRL